MCIRDRSNEVGPALASWVSFAKTLPEDFFINIAAEGIAAEILNQPPKKLVVDEDGRLRWQPSTNAVDNESLFESVRVIRNNLFHGSKHDFEKNQRDQLLVSEAHQVLQKALGYAPQVAEKAYSS